MVYMVKHLFSDTLPAVLGFSSSKSRVIDRATYTLVPLHTTDGDFELQAQRQIPRSATGSRRRPSSTMEKAASSRVGYVLKKLVSAMPCTR